MNSSTKRIAVIGAGPAGLVTLKELLEAGHQVTCFEKTSDIGGLFRFREDAGGVYDSLLLTSSVAITCFSDFAPPKNAPYHFKHNQYLQYLNDYAAHFKLRDHIRFEQEVRELKQNSDQSWALTACDLKSRELSTHTFAVVAVCSGMHQSAYIPPLPGLDSFPGEIYHSSRYKRPDRFKGKRVVVVGAGESGSDVADEVSKVTAECIACVRRGTLVVPRKVLGNPNDYYTNRLYYMLPTWVVRKHLERLPVLNIILGLFTCSVIILLFKILEQSLNWLIQQWPVIDMLLYGMCILLFLYITYRLAKLIVYDLPANVLNAIHLHLSDSSVGHAGQFTTKSTGMAQAVAEKRCQVKRAIQKIEGHKIIFADNSEFTADAVIFCTGYENNFPFLQKKQVDFRQLYKNCFDPDYGGTLGFIGFARPAIGAIPPIAEIQARWFTSVASGKTALPERGQMAKEIDADARWHKENFHKVTERVTGLVDYTRYMDEIAGLIGCKPDGKDLLKNPRLILHIFANPFSGNQYRLKGTDEQKKVARDMLTRIPLEPFWVIYCSGLAVALCMSHLLYLLGFKEFKLNLPFGPVKKETSP